MKEREDKETRYFLDLDLKTGRIINWGHEQRQKLSQKLAKPFQHRVFLTKGQHNKLVSRLSEIKLK